MKNKFYKDLDVPVDATGDEIKKAFREKSKEVHPDKGGSEDEFKEIQLAYSVLSDDEKRRRYDSTGEDEPEQTHMVGLCIQIFKGALDQNPDDIMDGIEYVADGIINNLKSSISSLRVKIKKNNKVISRIEKAPAHDFLKLVLETEIKADEKMIVINQKRIEDTEEALSLLSGYSFSVNERSYESCSAHKELGKLWESFKEM